MKRIFLTITALTLVLSFVGCSAGASKSTSVSPSETASISSEEAVAESSVQKPQSSALQSQPESRTVSEPEASYKYSSKVSDESSALRSKPESRTVSEPETSYKYSPKVSDESSAEQVSKKETSSADKNGSDVDSDAFKQALDDMFIGNNLEAVHEALVKQYNKSYVKEKFKYYDAVEGKSINLKKNWTIRKWSFDGNVIKLGCEKTAKGIESLKNLVDKILESSAYKIISGIADIVDKAKTLGIIKDD